MKPECSEQYNTIYFIPIKVPQGAITNIQYITIKS